MSRPKPPKIDTSEQKLVLLPKRTIEAVPDSSVIIPDERDMAWWLEDIRTGKSGRFRAPPRPPRHEEVVVAETEDQFNLLQTAAAAVEENERFARAANTLAAYASEWRVFVRWCVERGQKPMPASPAVVRAYIADISSRERPRVVRGTPRQGVVLTPLPPRKPKGLAVALAAIAAFHRQYGHPSPHQDPLVVEELERIKRRMGTAPAQKKPLRVEHLEKIIELLEEERRHPGGRTTLERKATARRALRDKAILLLGWAGAFRRDELAGLGVGDVAFRPEGLDTALAKSKTDQTGQGFLKAILKGEQEEMCPKRALEDWFGAMGAVTSGPIFREIDRCNRLVLNHSDAHLGLNGDAIALILKKRVQQIGLAPELYSGHSMRAGFVTAAAEAGRSAHEIMSLTGHKDPAIVFTYIRSAQRFDTSPGRGLL